MFGGGGKRDFGNTTFYFVFKPAFIDPFSFQRLVNIHSLAVLPTEHCFISLRLCCGERTNVFCIMRFLRRHSKSYITRFPRNKYFTWIALATLVHSSRRWQTNVFPCSKNSQLYIMKLREFHWCPCFQRELSIQGNLISELKTLWIRVTKFVEEVSYGIPGKNAF